ncbi:hypothetical protein GLW00_05990 [Halobacillus litoralis]|uniref:DUF2157 domain-containing protein n=1 Tax=Halobacillus litoralis TaxID=45668 RepID=A0A845F9R6_9BACI|nr:hypothetical protein [Halobacillus litoralis]MYL70387.1 hypothetical protein [Halobacillus litoralis]
MAALSKEEKQRVFREQLNHLKENGYITDQEYKKLLQAQGAYLADYESIDRKQSFIKQEDQLDSAPAQKKKSKPAPKPKPVKKKKERSPEQIRERNITWTLILGVSILLITGLIVATSQWDQLGAATKVVSISCVSLFFFALSYGTGRFLKIKQTAFAFLTLGSLLIPIVIVAIGYFELFGTYLSLNGEGRYLLGLMGTAIPLPLYVRHAFVHRSRLYVWISLLFLSLSVGFMLGTLPLSLDAFYLGLMLYNAGLLVVYIQLKSRSYLQLFLKEVPFFAQLNLVISTSLMLFFYENEVFYSFNLLLTASVYMAMVFVYKTKEYQFVFSVMLVYAVYQLVENTPLYAINSLVYAVVGLLYLGFAYAFRHHTFIEKVFRLTSGIVSFLAFIYITYESILIKEQTSSWLLLLAYIVIMINYLVLSNVTNHVIFTYLAPVFFFVSAAQLWDLSQTGPLFFFLFTAASLLFLYVGIWTKIKWLHAVKDSSFYTSLFVLTGCLYFALYDLQYGYSAVMLLIFSLLAYFVKKSSPHADMTRTAVWVHPSGLVAASVIFYQKLLEWVPAYSEGYSISFHIALTGILLLGLHYVWKKIGENDFAWSTFYIAEGTYVAAMLLLLTDDGVDPNLVRPLLLLGGIGMMYLLVHYSKKTYYWSLVSVASLAFYTSLIAPLRIDSFSSVLLFMVFAPVILIAVGEWGGQISKGMRPHFYLLGHIVQPFIILLILLDQLGPEHVHPVLLMIPLAVYVFSALKAGRESGIKTMLYAALTTGYFLVVTLPIELGWNEMPYEYAFLASSVLFAILWFFVSPEWKKRIEWYIIPFSILGLFVVISNVSLVAEGEWLMVIGYTVFTLFFLHQRSWPIVRFVPLLLTFGLWEKLRVFWTDMDVILVLALGTLVLLAAGMLLQKRLFGPALRADAYTWTALLYIGYLNLYTLWDESVWIRILPVGLLSLWFYLGGKKCSEKFLQNVFYTGTIVSIYGGYLMIIAAYNEFIPDLIMAEVQTLPVLMVLVFVRKKLWSASREVMSYVQLAALLLIAGYLVLDAIQSHTIWDAWIIGGLSLVSMITGMQLRIKSYFLVGMGVLIFNIIYQTRPYWGNLPWWVYLLIAGLVLIGIASYNEWQKQRSESEKPMEQKWKKLWKAFKKWQ